MATFKVGQRVRVMRQTNAIRDGVLAGREGVIVLKGGHGSLTDRDWTVELPGTLNSRGTSVWCFNSDQLAPLTDPKADAFIEQVKRWKPEPEPVKRELNVS